MAMGAISL